MKLWVTAGGTGSAWHICSIVKEYFSDRIELFVSDINDRELVASGVLADHFFKVPRADSEGYAEYMYDLLKNNEIDMIIPIIPWEQKFFSKDNEAFAVLNIRTAAPNSKTDEMLNNKKGLYEFCKASNIPTIKVFEPDEINDEETYFIKPLEGFGAAGARVISGKDIKTDDFDNNVIEEYCKREENSPNGEEITVEAFYDGRDIHTIARKRLEAKCGVCTKAKIMDVPEVNGIIKKFTESFEFPNVFNIQFIYHNNQWKVMDVNLRLAAGTGVSNAAGFQLIRAYMSFLLGDEVKEELFKVDKDIVSILRVYKEVVVR